MFSSRSEYLVLLLLAIAGGLGVAIPRFDGLGGETEQVQSDPAAEEEVAAESGDASTETATEETVTEEEPETEAVQAEFTAPEVDTMRFDGTTGVVAGTAMAGAKLFIKDGDQVIAEGEADQNGNFAMTFDYETPADGSILQLSSIDPDGNEIAANEAMTVLPLDTGETATATLDEEGVETETPQVRGLALGEMSYGSATPWSLAGTAIPGAVVDLFVNGEKFGTTTADANGRWEYQGEGIEPGTYELGLSQNGETPITQSITLAEAPTQTADASNDASAETGSTSTSSETNASTSDSGASSSSSTSSITIGDREYIVRRGDSLWRIAERFYGEGQGYRYTEIFDVNSSQIRNPDLIYPEQEFEIPTENE